MKTIISILIVAFSAACSRAIPQDIKNALDKQLALVRLENGWRLVKLAHGFGARTLVVDMLVAEPLAGDLTAQRTVLKSRICPATADNDEFWQKLDGYELSVVAYTQDRKFTVLADCEKP